MRFWLLLIYFWGCFNAIEIKSLDIPSLSEDTIVINNLIRRGSAIFDQKPDSSFIYWSNAIDLSKSYLKKDKNEINKNIYLNTIARAQTNIGRYYRNKGQYNKAIDFYFKSLKILQTTQDTFTMALNLNNLGIIYLADIKDYEKAEYHFKKGIELLKRIKDRRHSSILYTNLGKVYQEQKNYKDAFKNYYESLAINLENQEEYGISYSTSVLGELYLELNNLDSTYKYIMQSLEIRERNNDIKGVSSTCILIAKYYLKKDDLKNAERYAKKALIQAEIIKFPKYTISALKLLTEIYEKKNNFKEALLYYKRYQVLNDSIFKNDYEKELLKQQLEYNFSLKSIEDSLKFENKNKEREIIISNQNKIIQVNNRLKIVYVFIIILILVLSLLLYRRLQYKKQKKELELQLRIIETEQVLKRALMNPHFLFNSLNSIQTLILKNENKIARNYIVKISKLMRLILDQAEKQIISLHEEIETIELYFEMEQLRFKEKFIYSIHVDSSLQVNNIKVPALVIQPFIENAIIHGIQNLKDKQGSIQVHFLNGVDFLYCEIVDNGIGLQAAENSKTSQYHQNSFGIKSVSERLRNMNSKANNEEQYVSIFERKDEEGNIVGTTASIKIPFIKSV